MRKYIYHFDTESDFNEMRSAENYDEPWVSLTEDIERIDFNKTEEEKERERLLGTPLTFEIQSDGEIVWKTSSGNTKTIEYSKNGGEWTSITSSTGGTSISVVNGDTVQFRGNNSSYSTSSSRYNTFSGSTAQFSVKGNIMSLINSTNFSGLTEFPSNSSYNFCNLFKNTSVLASQSLVLPATTLTENCYQNMFNECTSLTGAPELPATTLAPFCYNSMFGGCTSLTTAPELPATTLANCCYQSMFGRCGLTTAPALPATTLINYCYEYMFSGCKNLIQTPELPATTLANGCYSNMFYNCTNLNYIKCLATDISATYCTNSWVRGVASTGTFITPSSTSWSTGNDGIPSGWTRVDA